MNDFNLKFFLTFWRWGKFSVSLSHLPIFERQDSPYHSFYAQVCGFNPQSSQEIILDLTVHARWCYIYIFVLKPVLYIMVCRWSSFLSCYLNLNFINLIHLNIYLFFLNIFFWQYERSLEKLFCWWRNNFYTIMLSVNVQCFISWCAVHSIFRVVIWTSTSFFNIYLFLFLFFLLFYNMKSV